MFHRGYCRASQNPGTSVGLNAAMPSPATVSSVSPPKHSPLRMDSTYCWCRKCLGIYLHQYVTCDTEKHISTKIKTFLQLDHHASSAKHCHFQIIQSKSCDFWPGHTSSLSLNLDGVFRLLDVRLVDLPWQTRCLTRMRRCSGQASAQCFNAPPCAPTLCRLRRASCRARELCETASEARNSLSLGVKSRMCNSWHFLSLSVFIWNCLLCLAHPAVATQKHVAFSSAASCHDRA